MTGINKILQKIGLTRPTEEPKPTVHISRRYLGTSAHGPRMSFRR